MNVFVGCSSRDTPNESYNRIAEEIGNFIVHGKHNLVFGGSDTGLMGKIYSIVSKSTNSKVLISTAMPYAYHLNNLSYDNLYLSKTINERKDYFVELSDVMIFIPGGIGTMDEIYSAIETKRSQKRITPPIIILNVNNYFSYFISMLNQIYDEGFADSKNRDLYYIADSLEEGINYLSCLPKSFN